MAKKPRRIIPAYKKNEGRERSRPYLTTSGLDVVLTGLPPMVPRRIDSSIKYPDKPTYEVTTAAGDVETYEHDETTLQSDDDKKAWANYLEAQEEAETELTEKLVYAVLVECVTMRNYEDRFATWKQKQGFIGIELSEDEERNKFDFMQTEVFHDADDIGEILTIVMSLTGVSVEDLAEARNSFPGEVESKPQAGNGDTARQSEDSGK